MSKYQKCSQMPQLVMSRKCFQKHPGSGSITNTKDLCLGPHVTGISFWDILLNYALTVKQTNLTSSAEVVYTLAVTL